MHVRTILMPLDLILTMQVQFGHAGPIWALWVMFWTILGPPGVPKRPQSGPIWHIMMYYTCEKCFRATWTLPGRLLACWLISARGVVSWATQITFLRFSPKAPSAGFFRQLFPKDIAQTYPMMWDLPMIYFFWPKLRSPPLCGAHK